MAPIVELQNRGENRVIVVRTSAAHRSSARGLAWFVGTVGITGLAGLGAMRVPDAWYVGFTAFLALTSLVVAWDAREGDAAAAGEIAVPAGVAPIHRVRGLDQLGWDSLALPERAMLVIGWSAADPRAPVAERERGCRVIAAPCLAESSLWPALQASRRLPDGVTVASDVPYDLARGLADALGGARGWAVADLTADPELRRPPELHVPLASRASVLSEALEVTPSPRRPSGASVASDGAGTYLGLRDLGWPGLVAQALVAAPLLGLLFVLSHGHPGVPAVGIAALALRAGGRTRVDLSPEGIVVRPLTAWLPLDDEIAFSWREVQAVQAVTEGGAVGLRLVTEAGSAFIPTSSRAAARWAAWQIRRYLAARGSPSLAAAGWAG